MMLVPVFDVMTARVHTPLLRHLLVLALKSGLNYSIIIEKAVALCLNDNIYSRITLLNQDQILKLSQYRNGLYSGKTLYDQGKPVLLVLLDLSDAFDIVD